MRKKIFKDTLFLSASILIYQGVRIVQTFLIMHFLNPHYYGIWLGLNIVLMYGVYAHLGVEYGFAMRLPYYQGQNKTEQALKASDTGYLAWSVLTLICALTVIGYGVSAPRFSGFERMGLVIIAGLMVAEQQIAFLSRWNYSGPKNFKMPSILSVIRSIISFCVLVPMTYFFNVEGVMIGSLLVAVFFVAIWWVKTPYRFKGDVSLASFSDMIKIGFPILLVVLGGQLIETSDQILIISFLGSASLGYYGVAWLAGNVLYGLVSQAGCAISPHITENFGKVNDSTTELRKYLLKPTILFSYLMSVLLMLLVFSLPPLALLFLPQYAPGLRAFYFLIPGFFFLGIILTANNILNLILISKKRQRWIVYFQIIAIIIKIGLGLWFIKLGWNISGVALASTLAYVVYGGTILYWASHYVLSDYKERLGFLGEVIAPFIIVIIASGLIYWLGQKIIPQHLALRSATQLFLCILSIISLVIRLNRKTGVFGDIKPIISALALRVQGVS